MKTALKIIAVISIAAPAFASASFAGETQSRSDIGQQLQLALQEANNIYTRSNKAQSDIQKKYDATAAAIAQNLK